MTNPSTSLLHSFKKYEYSSILGWSISRYEVFDKCKRQYYYTYYSKYVTDVPQHRIRRLKELTSVPLEIGNVVHDVIEVFLKRLQRDDSRIDEERFFCFAREKTREYFTHKTFQEIYYRVKPYIELERVLDRVEKCFRNFLSSSCCNWIFMKAITNRTNWMIEPSGYGETRIDEMKAYCKMDFLFPVGDELHILDWKTGKKDHYKHSLQLVAYALAGSIHYNISWKNIFPKIVYLYPHVEEFTLPLKETDFDNFRNALRNQTNEMLQFCVDAEKNIPRDIEAFPKNPSASVCQSCNFWELCFPSKPKISLPPEITE